jgi:transposase InsO family protein
LLYRVAVIDWASRAVLAWRLSNTMDVSFRVSALEEALARFGTPETFNTDSKNDGVGKLSTIASWQSDEWSEHRRHSEVSSVALTRTPIDHALRLSLDLSGG